MIRALVRAVLTALLVTVAIALVILNVPHRPHDPAAIRQASGNVVLYDHAADCWTGEAPTDAIPTHVIARLPDGPWRYAGQAWTDRALNKAFKVTPNDPIIPLAFCY